MRGIYLKPKDSIEINVIHFEHLNFLIVLIIQSRTFLITDSGVLFFITISY